MATLRWGMRDVPPATDVAELQRALRDLGYDPGPIDGYFGPRTRSAVLAFQRAAGLAVDGIVGPQTATALGLAAGPGTEPSDGGTAGPVKGGRRESVHIGINRVDPGAYGGWNGALSGCENDCDTMTVIAEAEGYTTRALKTPQATSTAILDAIGDAAGRLRAGDTFLLTYAGHGGQVPNGDADTDPESDARDETWVCFDRQLIDDELWRAWQDFDAGVDVVVISDSCHSGTIARLFLLSGGLDGSYADPAVAQAAREAQRATYATQRAFYTDLAAPRPGLTEPAVAAFPRPLRAGSARSPAATATRELIGQGAATAPRRFPPRRGVATRDAGAGDGAGGGVLTREMPLEENERDVAARGDLYAELQLPGKREVRGTMQCNVVSLSGCTDMQLSQEVGGHGVFTTTLNRVWAGNTWAGSYQSLITTIQGQMGPTQIPQLGVYGAAGPRLAASTPF